MEVKNLTRMSIDQAGLGGVDRRAQLVRQRIGKRSKVYYLPFRIFDHDAPNAINPSQRPRKIRD